jgi:hypothetical protein
VASRQLAAVESAIGSAIDPGLERQQIMPIGLVTPSEPPAVQPRLAYRLPMKLWALQDDLLAEPVSALPAVGLNSAFMDTRAQALVSAMAAFGAGSGDAALANERQTIMPVRHEPLWVSPAAM